MDITQWKSKAKLGRASWCVKHDDTQRFFKTKDEAQRYVEKAKTECVGKTISKSWDWSIVKLISEYLVYIDKQKKKSLISETAYRGRVRHAKQLLSAHIDGESIKYFKVRDITVGHFKLQLIPEIAEGRSRKTVANIMGSFKNIFDYAKTVDCRNTNPAEGISLIDLVAKTDDFCAEKIQPDVIGKIIDAMDDYWKVVTFFAVATGLRQGEQRAITWSDILWDQNKIRINKAVKHCTRDVGDTKTPKGRRSVDMVPELKAQLQELYMKAGRPDDSSLIFTNNFKPLNAMNFRRKIIRACEDAGVDQIRWHDLRHFFASRLLQRFPNDLWRVSNLLGHENTKITTGIYGHWLDEDDSSETLNIMSDAFAGFSK
jgi:integrase